MIGRISTPEISILSGQNSESTTLKTEKFPLSLLVFSEGGFSFTAFNTDVNSALSRLWCGHESYDFEGYKTPWNYSKTLKIVQLAPLHPTGCLQGFSLFLHSGLWLPIVISSKYIGKKGKGGDVDRKYCYFKLIISFLGKICSPNK